MSPNGDRISKNCANFSAASVDNVKDPVLADLMQNTQTANIAGFMLRAGMSVEEIGLLFSQPLVRRCITETGGLKKLGSYKDIIDKYSTWASVVSRIVSCTVSIVWNRKVLMLANFDNSIDLSERKVYISSPLSKFLDSMDDSYAVFRDKVPFL